MSHTNLTLSLNLVRGAYDKTIRPTLTGKKARRADKVMVALMMELERIDALVRAKRGQNYET